MIGYEAPEECCPQEEPDRASLRHITKLATQIRFCVPPQPVPVPFVGGGNDPVDAQHPLLLDAAFEALTERRFLRVVGAASVTFGDQCRERSPDVAHQVYQAAGAGSEKFLVCAERAIAIDHLPIAIKAFCSAKAPDRVIEAGNRLLEQRRE